MAEYKIFNRYGGEGPGVCFFVLLFQDVVWLQFFLYREKKMFLWGGIGNAGRDIPSAKKNEKVVQKIIPTKVKWQCGKEVFSPADSSV